jgi:hypothetical protein
MAAPSRPHTLARLCHDVDVTGTVSAIDLTIAMQVV